MNTKLPDYSAYDIRNLAHARLITAAPDLLSVCEELVKNADHTDDDAFWGVPIELLDKVKAAIAKATEVR